MMYEDWRPVAGYEDDYECSNMGRVRSIKMGRCNSKRIIGTNQNPIGYYRVSLYKNGRVRTRFVHQVATEAFIGPCPLHHEVCHGPGGKADNRLCNLSYGQRKDNNLDKRRDGTHGGIRVVRSDGASFVNAGQAAEQSGCNRSGIQKVCAGLMKTSGGYGWNYEPEEEETTT